MSRRVGYPILVALTCLVGCRDQAAKSSSERSSSQTASKAKTKVTEHRVLDVPQDRIFVAGRGVEVIDAAAGQAVGGLDWKTEISQLRFTQNGLRAFAASSSGVFEFDPHKLELRQVFTNSEGVSIRLAPNDDKLFILEAPSNSKQGSETKSMMKLKVFDLANSSLTETYQLPKDVIDFIPAHQSMKFSIFRFDDGRIALAENFSLSTFRIVPELKSRSTLFSSPETSLVHFLENAKNSPLVEFDGKNGKWKRVFSQEGLEFSNLSVTNDGQQLLLSGSVSNLILQYPGYEVSQVLKRALGQAPVAFSLDRRRLYYLQLDDEQKSYVNVLLLDKEKFQGRIPTESMTARIIEVHPRSEYAAFQVP